MYNFVKSEIFFKIENNSYNFINSKFEKFNLFCKDKNIIPIFLFELNLTSKDKIKEELKKISLQKNEIISYFKNKNLEKNLDYKFGIIIKIENKIENFYQGIINNLRLDFDILIGFGGLNKINRYFIENTKIDFLLNPQSEYYKKKQDFIHHFNIGLNHILLNMMKEKKISLIFSLNFFFKQNNNYKISKEIGRINKIILLANKWKIPVLIHIMVDNIYLIKTQKQVESFYYLFDKPTQTINFSKNFLDIFFKNRKIEKSEKYITDGIILKDN